MTRNSKDREQPAEASAIGALRRISAVELFAGSREVIVEHEGQYYRLRITSNGKLILTK